MDYTAPLVFSHTFVDLYKISKVRCQNDYDIEYSAKFNLNYLSRLNWLSKRKLIKPIYTYSAKHYVITPLGEDYFNWIRQNKLDFSHLEAEITHLYAAYNTASALEIGHQHDCLANKATRVGTHSIENAKRLSRIKEFDPIIQFLGLDKNTILDLAFRSDTMGSFIVDVLNECKNKDCQLVKTLVKKVPEENWALILTKFPKTRDLIPFLSS